VKYGLIPEFIGRVPVAVTLDLLDEDALVRILTEPKSAICKQYKKLFELDGVELEFEEEALKAIAKETMKRKTGARGLRAIIEKAVTDLMYEVPSNEEIAKCVITKEVVEGTGEPEIIYSDTPRPRKSFTKRHPKKNNGEIA
jgi:ATP-dependent Clp protease ATP-binding subunit ClpX